MRGEDTKEKTQIISSPFFFLLNSKRSSTRIQMHATMTNKSIFQTSYIIRIYM